MRKLTIIMLVLTLAFSSSAFAQLGNLDDVAKKAVKDAAGDKAKSDGKSTSDQAKKADAPQADKGRSRPPVKKDKDRKFPPGLAFASVLNGVKLLAKDGLFDLDKIQATFVPEDNKGGFVVLRTADGKELYQWDWKPEWLKKPYALLNVYNTTDLGSGKKISDGFIDLAKPGDYVLDFYLPDEHFYTFPFKIVKIKGADPFAGGDCYLLDGDWEDCAYWFYPEADASQSLSWKVWLRNKGIGEADAKIRLEVKRDADGTLVCQNREDTSFTLKPEWVRYEFDVIFPPKGTSGGAYFKAKDLLATDGDYTLTLNVNDKPRGTWKFAVKDGKLNYTGRSLRGQADPLTFIEGGRDAWWYTRQEAQKKDADKPKKDADKEKKE